MDLSCGDGHSGICWTGLRALLIRGSGVRIPPGALFRRSAGMCVAVPMVYRMPGHSFRPESDDPVTVEAGRMDAPHDVVRQRRPLPLNRIWTQALAWASMLRTRRKRGEGPRTGLSSAPAGERSAHGVGEHVGRVGVGWGKLPKLGLQRKQRPEDVGLGVEALVVAHEVAASIGRLVHVERTPRWFSAQVAPPSCECTIQWSVVRASTRSTRRRRSGTAGSGRR
jgi:hypothetical protein